MKENRIALLEQVDKTVPRVTKAVITPISQQGLQDSTTTFGHIKREIVKVIGNMAYENRNVQDEVSDYWFSKFFNKA